MKVYAIITAGGTSSRYGNTNKLLEKVHSKEVIRHTVDKFLASSSISKIVISAHSSIINVLEEFYSNEPRLEIVLGGITRQESVYNALKISQDADYVLIHDGARPMITKEKIEEAIELVQFKKALTVGAKTIDTIKQVDENLKIIKTIDRSNLYNTQTPQAFEYDLILNAHQKLECQNFTDDAGMLEALGYCVYILEGDYKNIKITTQADIAVASTYL